MGIDPIVLPPLVSELSVGLPVDKATGSERVNDMVGRSPSRIAALVLATVLLLTPYLSASPAAARDRAAPTKPKNFRVTSTTPFSVTLAWEPSTDKSGNFSYLLGATTQPSQRVTLPHTATSYTFDRDLYPRNTYWFTIQAINAAGNYSSPIGVSATLPADTTPPAVAPVVSVADVGPSYVSLAWTPAQDDGPYLFYEVWVNGSRYADAGTNTSFNVQSLQQQTAYTFSVRARDYGNNWSPMSNTVNVTTEANDPGDTSPPTTPTFTSVSDWGCAEVELIWSPSTDNVTAQSMIRYDVYVNDVFDHSLFGRTKTIVYGTLEGANTLKVIAVDTNGNQSAPAIVTLNLVPC
jgi:chitodextrinase